MNTATTAFDTEALRRGIEERDAATLRALYTPDAEMTVVDRNAPPSHPRVLHGRTAIGEYLDETCGRDMTHRLERVVSERCGENPQRFTLGPDPNRHEHLRDGLFPDRWIGGRLCLNRRLRGW